MQASNDRSPCFILFSYNYFRTTSSPDSPQHTDQDKPNTLYLELYEVGDMEEGTTEERERFLAEVYKDTNKNRYLGLEDAEMKSIGNIGVHMLSSKMSLSLKLTRSTANIWRN
ncbi:hypothetical protein H112_04927 [Trichophyton rubrum D6]|uniref:Uncharacterized protein n=3 Tax=Trichophyton TaxID=5550 RepID=A0A080WNA0_TRIRC|nr:uncharacterized protein TERG_12176 [Trichophyton rubrum CBS 118892]EZF22119.1 hypothetical protein H100_04950 [Trichophyton rubrum MR850]EZF41162.1 hypothetical protein H102_04936 [Trichophyton rubrum CBS 100081]EZF51831.1 hypothetical protein H103_04939 [Trichophyton rubrum CBS 288.86]EZF62414.1 hypothetical protein H104_04931 [Trichophyton rubrum CBS 289.86]EZF73053.1 hypothetical protein H105_04956 [Trichophyton soudanense CBS 452.61]EZF83730.1 hypothetical protein H110_04937 [Trichophy